MPRLARIRRFAPWAAVLALILILGGIVRDNAVNTPLWDDWERGPLLRKSVDGELTFADLYAAHIQHRMVVPRLATLALNRLSNGDLRWEMALTFLQMVAAALLLLLVARRTLQGPALATGVGLLAAAAVLSPMQYQNFLWATQFAITAPATALLLCLTCWMGKADIRLRFALCLGLAVAGTHTFSHGLLLWPALLILFACSPQIQTMRARALLCGLWLTAAAIVYAFYFTNLENTSDPAHAYLLWERDGRPTGFAAVRGDPGAAWGFFAALCGSGLVRAFPQWATPLETARLLGNLQIGALVALGAWFLIHFRDHRVRERMLPWMVIGAFGVLATAAVTYGRIGILSEGRALSPRYISLSLYATVGIIGAAGVVIAHLRETRPTLPGLPAFPPLAAGALAVILSLNWLEGATLARHFGEARLQAKARLPLLPHMPLAAHHLVDGSHSFLLEQALFLDSQGWLKPRLLPTPYLEHIPQSSSTMSRSRAAITQVKATPEGWQIHGHANTPGSGRPADAVLICAETPAGSRILGIAEAPVEAASPRIHHDFEFTQWTRHRPPANTPWHYDLDADTLPADATTITVWVIDGERWRAHRLEEKIDLDDNVRPPPEMN